VQFTHRQALRNARHVTEQRSGGLTYKPQERGCASSTPLLLGLRCNEAANLTHEYDRRARYVRLTS
jgi:hypothetical protein